MRLKRITIAVFTVLLCAATAYSLLSTFVIEQRLGTVPSSVSASQTVNGATSDSTSTVTVTTQVVDDTTVYVADVVLGDTDTIQSALADDTYGRNITDTTSNIASSVGATLAINGDFYGARTSGYVIRNGQLLRDTSAGDDQEDLVLWSDGTMSIVREGDVTAQQLLDQGALQVLSFGPGLVEDGTVSVTADSEVGQAMASNPRTAIGMISAGHYVLVVADGRTSESEGLSLLQLAQFMQSLGAQQAYNLDGGGSSTMYYDGEVVNKPTTDGTKISERAVSDILYIG